MQSFHMFPGAASAGSSAAASPYTASYMPVAATTPAERLSFIGASPQKKPKVKIPLYTKLAVGGIAGVVGTCCIFPLDMVKTRLQNQVIAADGTRMYRGPIHCFKTILRQEGARGLYSGLTANLIGVTPEKAIKLAVNDYAREHLESEDGTISLGNEAAAGAIAGFCQVTATNPMEITKIRMQLAMLEGRAVTTTQVVKELGLRGMYTGVTTTWVRDIPYSIIFFPLYANLKKLAGGDDASMPAIFVAGGAAAAIAAGSCTPADVVKTRLQVKGAATRYNGMIDCFTKILRSEGAGAFFKGVGPRMAVQAPLFGIALLAFEVQKKFLGDQLNQEHTAWEERQKAKE